MRRQVRVLVAGVGGTAPGRKARHMNAGIPPSRFVGAMVAIGMEVMALATKSKAIASPYAVQWQL